MLSRACDLAHDKIMSQDWGDNVAKAYLRSNALNNELISGVIDHAKRCKLKEEAFAQKEDKPEAFDEFKKNHDRDPESFDKLKQPSIWHSGLKMFQVPCIIMHILFLGIVKCVVTQLLGGSKATPKTAISFATRRVFLRA